MEASYVATSQKRPGSIDGAVSNPIREHIARGCGVYRRFPHLNLAGLVTRHGGPASADQHALR